MLINRSGKMASAVVVVLALGCHSVQLRSPIDPHSDLHAKWLKDYREARAAIATDPARACAVFKSLAEDSRFPAHPLAGMRAWAVCEPNAFTAPDRATLAPWLQDLGLETALQLASKNGDKAAEMELAIEKSKQKLPQSEKLKWTELAIKRARELKQPEKVTEFTKRTYVISPRLNPHPPESQFLAVANDLRLGRKFEASRAYYGRVIKSSHFNLDDKVSAFKGIRLSHKNARDHEAHLEASKDLVKYLRHAEKLNSRSHAVRYASFDAEMYVGRALWTLGRAAEARQTFLAVEKRLRGKLSLAELYWVLGRMAEEAGQPDEVHRYMELALKERITDQELRDKILWYSAWNERQRKNHPRAAEILTELDQKTQGEFTRVRTLFWLGKTYADMDKLEESKQVLERLITLDPLGYYGLLAHRHLGLAISFRRAPPDPTGDLTASTLPLDLALAEWLGLLDEKDALNELLGQAADAYRRQSTQSDEGWTTLFRQYAKNGLYQKLYQQISGLTSERRKSIVEKEPELLFPQPFLEDVKLAGLQHNVDEELIYAIMRQESAFDPRARSGADAFGLMQILPEIAEGLSKETQVPYAHMEDLYTPRTNIQFGAAHIRELLQRHKGQFILAVAAYNASEKAINTWMQTRYRGDSLEFIEEIPYEETRVYVRLVMRNLIFYSLLKSKSASIEFPAWVLKLGPS